MGARRGSSRIISEAISAIMRTQALICPETIVGITEASTTRRRSMPKTRSLLSTTAPIAQVPQGWFAVTAVLRNHCSMSSSDVIDDGPFNLPLNGASAAREAMSRPILAPCTSVCTSCGCSRNLLKIRGWSKGSDDPSKTSPRLLGWSSVGLIDSASSKAGRMRGNQICASPLTAQNMNSMSGTSRPDRVLMNAKMKLGSIVPGPVPNR